MVSADLGIKLESVTVNMLGHAKKVMIDKENTTIVGGAGKKADIQGRIPQLNLIPYIKYLRRHMILEGTE